MRSPAFTIAWSIWSRQRTGFIVSAATLAALAIVSPLLAPVVPSVAIVVSSAVPLVVVFAFVLNALLVVEERGSLLSRFPRHMLTLPVRTWTLAFWPTFFASSTAALLWAAAAFLIYPPSGYQIPVLIPALGLAALMAWTQALAWLPIAVYVLRAVIYVLIVGALGALPLWLTLTERSSPKAIAGLLIVYLAAAYVLAWTALTSVRHGQAWHFWPALLRFTRITRPLARTRRNRPFRSPFAAQFWYEWNCHGLMLNGFVGAVLSMIWAILLLVGRHHTPLEFEMILGTLLFDVVGCIAATGVSLGRSRPFWTHVPGTVMADVFVATRPMTTGGLVAAKFRMAAASVAGNWVLAVAGTIVWIVVTGNLDNATIVTGDFLNRYPGGRGTAIIALAFILLPALSWTLLTGVLVPVLTGRRWVSDGAVWGYLALVISLGVCGSWLTKHPEHLPRFYSVLPWLIAGIAALKATAAVAAFRAVWRLRLMSWRNIAAVLRL